MVTYPLDSKTTAIVIPCHFQQNNNRILANLVFDTGATLTMVSWKIADTLNLRPYISRNKIPFNTASGLVEAPIVKVNKISIRDIYLKNVEVIVHDLPEGSRVDGLLGLDFIKQFKIEINFKKRKISLDKF